ncbi:glycosyltransferase family 2 protein [Flavobacterium sp. MFBS3-15]|uniref:glycosyltransferase family 2 protein n=1 Tax=Flavobacterium sp. MFBS3-15 TaxID=2989816 RepID=UPI0022356261|nr:glycosyltransferase family 2 protein [Flavobacterium sp. MFBS3-15]MCW4470689.1 glycosyltransferase family 2 protein [Flavobacterium sp. MFBS3-15]
MDKKVFVIIVTYNGARWIDKNIASLLASSYPVSIIAIDNDSTDNSVALLEKYPQVQLVKSPENLGFGKANNIGMQMALEQGGDYLFLLNQDAWVFDDTIGRLVDVMEMGMQKTGIASPTHYIADGQTLDANFKTYLKRSKPLKQEGLFTANFVNAAAWMLSRECVQGVGFFEPLFGHYGEDRNYCDRVLYHGFLMLIDRNAGIVHDRVITRNFKKDITQSQYKILATLIDPNRSLPGAYLQGLKEALGLPKYFSKFYSRAEARQMAKALLGYYWGFIIKPGQVTAARKRAK